MRKQSTARLIKQLETICAKIEVAEIRAHEMGLHKVSGELHDAKSHAIKALKDAGW